MKPEELEYIARVWPAFFPKEAFNKDDQRLKIINVFHRYFFNENSENVLLGLENGDHVSLDIAEINTVFPDFKKSLSSEPNNIICYMGIALSLTVASKQETMNFPRPVWPSLKNLHPQTNYGDLKSNAVGQLVSIRGYVTRVTSCKPLIESAIFSCSKCSKDVRVRFEDGVFTPPNICPTDKCRNRYLDLQRSSAVFVDYQRLKLQEILQSDGDNDGDDDGGEGRDRGEDELSPDTTGSRGAPRRRRGGEESRREVTRAEEEAVARVPHSFEVELRGWLVDSCVPGDVVDVLGVVKALQSDVYKGGSVSRGAGGRGASVMGRESGLHQLYLQAHSLDRRKGLAREAPVDTYDQEGGEGVFEGGADGEKGDIWGDTAGGDEEEYGSFFDMTGGNTGGEEGSGVGAGAGSRKRRRKSETAAVAEVEQESLGTIRAIAACGDTAGLLVASLCPTIFGQELVKLGLLLALFGGTLRIEKSGPKPRSDIHVLVVGDPGLGKSQLLRAVAAVAPRSVYVCGNTATTAGLTVAVTREGKGEMAIEAGALVLGDNGVCCVDEFDKMTCDPSSLLEAMEQQRISIAKSGVVTALRSRTAVVAAANPVGGHYNRRKTVCENLKVPAALLSRFDLVFVLLDRADENRDRMISEHIMRTHQAAGRGASDGNGRRSAWSETQATQGVRGVREGPGEGLETLTQGLKRLSAAHQQHPIPPTLLRAYITNARRSCHPRLTPQSAKVLQRLYLTMRARSMTGDSIPVTTRHLESLVRLAQARAKMELRQEVTESDAEDVLGLLQESLLEVNTGESGQIDCSRRGGLSLAKQVKALASALSREAQLRETSGSYTSSNKKPTVFTRQEIEAIGLRLGVTGSKNAAVGMGMEGVIDVMRTEGYLLLKGPRIYELNL